MNKVYFICILSLLFSQCCDKDLSRGFSLYNNSDSPISYYMPWENGLYYPDTILPELIPYLHKFDKEYHFSFGEGNFHENALFELFPTDTMSVFFFDPDTLAKYNWVTIKEEYNVLVRYDLSHDDLKRLGWCIYYPPTETMQDVKMYPAYDP